MFPIAKGDRKGRSQLFNCVNSSIKSHRTHL
jgi:hypothetical protein